MFYIEAVTRIQGKLACTQAKCTWILPTYVNEVPYAKVRDIDFSSAKKLKSALEQKIETSHQNTGEGSLYHDSVVIEVEEQTNDLLGGRLIALARSQCSNKQMAVTVGFLQLRLLPAWSLE